MAEEIILNHLTFREYAKHIDKSPRSDWEHYKELVKWMLHIKEIYFFESELFQEHKVETMDELLARHPENFVPAGKKNKHLKDFSPKDHITKNEQIEKMEKDRGGWKPEDFENTWFDISLPKFYITPEEPYYDEFFVYQLRNLDILEIDDFLNYQLPTYFESEIDKFNRFVSLSLRKHGDRLMLPDQIKTVQEWQTMIESKQDLSGIDTEVNKPKKTKISRQPGDNITSLNLVQTAYFVNILKQSKIIIKEDSLLPAKRAGEAFNMLTGYSEDTLRLRMNLKGQSDVTYTDRKAVREIINKILILIDKEIAEQRGEKS